MSALDAAIRAFRTAAMQRERTASTALTRAYSAIWDDLSRDLRLLNVDIQAARDRGEAVSADWLRRQARYQALLAQTEAQIRRYAQYAEATVLAERRAAVLAATETTGRLLQAALGEAPPGVFVTFNRLPTTAIEQLVGILADDAPLRALFDGWGAQASQAAGEALVSALGRGVGARQAARELREAVHGVSAVRALRISRSEINRAYRNASLATYAENADLLEGWVWHCAGTARTCAVCFAKHGSLHKVSEPFASHPVCRCAAIPRTKSWDALGFPGIPDARPAIEDGEALFARLSPEEQRQVLGPGKYDLWKSGAIQLEQLARTTRSKTWGPGLREATLGEARQFAERARIPILGQFKSITDAEKWGKANYPHITWDLAGCDPRVLNHALAQFDKLAKEWPDAAAGLKYVGTYDQSGPVMQALGYHPSAVDGLRGSLKGAVAHANGDLIGFNPEYFGDYDKIIDTVRRHAASGFQHKGGGSIEALITHEFGHTLDFSLRRSREALARYVRLDDVGMVKDLHEKFRTENRAKRTVSIYATTNAEESFAEMFAMRYHVPQKEWPAAVRRMDEYLRTLQQTKRYKPSEFEYVFDLPRDERTAKNEELLDWWRATLKRLGLKE